MNGAYKRARLPTWIKPVWMSKPSLNPSPTAASVMMYEKSRQEEKRNKVRNNRKKSFQTDGRSGTQVPGSIENKA